MCSSREQTGHSSAPAELLVLYLCYHHCLLLAGLVAQNKLEWNYNALDITCCPLSTYPELMSCRRSQRQVACQNKCTCLTKRFRKCAWPLFPTMLLLLLRGLFLLRDFGSETAYEQTSVDRYFVPKLAFGQSTCLQGSSLILLLSIHALLSGLLECFSCHQCWKLSWETLKEVKGQNSKWRQDVDATQTKRIQTTYMCSKGQGNYS